MSVQMGRARESGSNVGGMLLAVVVAIVIVIAAAYFVLSGEVQGTMDGRTYSAKPGDVFWTSVGCVHTFINGGNQPVRWLETFAPIPPAENVFRFMREWEKRAKELEG